VAPGRRAYACIPRDSLPGFVAALEEGALDDVVAAYLALTSRRRVLSAPEQTTRLGLYDQIGAPAELLAPERDPQTGHQESGGQGAKRTSVRAGKRNRQEQAAPKKASRFAPRAAAIGVAAAVLLAGAGAAAAVLSREHSGTNGNPPAPVSFQPSALSFPAVPVNASITRSVTMTNNGSSPATITRISIGGPSRHDFSVLAPSHLDAAYRSAQAIHPGAQKPPCHRRVLHGQTCTITVVFAPSAPGSRIADLHIYLAAPLQPQDITLSGTGTIAPPPSSVSVSGVSPVSGPAGGGTGVVITGRGFTGATGVSFGGTAATNFTVDPAGAHITATSPPGTGTVDITVTTPAGTSAASPADRFT
jgi:IPT/TIG domain/Cep192 domain 4